MSIGLMNHLNPRWEEFRERLEGPEGCNFRYKVPGDPESVTWDCGAGRDQTHAVKILAAMGATLQEIAHSCAYFTAHGGFCDCEILFNVDADQRPRPRRRKSPRKQLAGTDSRDSANSKKEGEE